MDHEFELAFNLIDEAAGRIQHQQYGITRILFHNHGDIALTTVHDYTRDSGHRLVLFATDAHGQLAAVEATAPDLNTEPHTRILKVRAGDLTFHGVTRPVTLDVTFHGAGSNPMSKAYTVGFDARGSLKRSDFGVSKYVPLVGDTVDLTISAPFEKTPG